MLCFVGAVQPYARCHTNERLLEKDTGKVTGLHQMINCQFRSVARQRRNVRSRLPSRQTLDHPSASPWPFPSSCSRYCLRTYEQTFRASTAMFPAVEHVKACHLREPTVHVRRAGASWTVTVMVTISESASSYLHGQISVLGVSRTSPRCPRCTAGEGRHQLSLRSASHMPASRSGNA